MGKKAKIVPPARVAADPKKIPKWQEHLINGDMPMVWRFSICDKDGPFRWRQIAHEDLASVIESLSSFEGMSWEEIIATGSHPISKDKLEKSAVDRLNKIKQDDIDELMSFRITARKRVWAIQDGSIMRILWWDPEHLVCPWVPDPADRRRRNKRKNR